jgi:hypothetical protein
LNRAHTPVGQALIQLAREKGINTVCLCRNTGTLDWEMHANYFMVCAACQSVKPSRRLL